MACSAIRAALAALDRPGAPAFRLAEARRILTPYADLDARQPRAVEPAEETA